MKRQLSQIITELGTAESRLLALADIVPDELWPKRNEPERWSIAECVAHLNLTSEAYIPLLEQAFVEAKKLPAARGQYRRDYVGAIFGALVGPLPAIGRFRIGRVKTPASFVPTGTQPKNVNLAEFKRLQMELSRLVREGDGLALDKVRITSPFGGKVRYNCYSALVMLPRHEMRHIQQAEGVWGP